jgi:hypothetical protein
MLRRMSDQDLFQAYEAELKANELLDRAYYFNPSPTTVDRAAYHRRQERAENLRLHFYAALKYRDRFPAKERATSETDTENGCIT